MRNIVIFDEYGEIDLKPSELLNRYIQLTKEDVLSFLIEGRSLRECVCPGCTAKDTASTFNKFGLTYKECLSCGTLYVSPRPPQKDIDNYYLRSRARKFWRDELFRATSGKRKEKMIKPRLNWVAEAAIEHLPGAKHLADINTAHYEYIEQILRLGLFDKRTIINPFLKLDNSRLAGETDVVESELKDICLREKADIISAFEVLDHTSDIEGLLSGIDNILNPGGLMFITAILASGFDLQVLEDKAESLFPPDRLNVFTVEGLKLLLKRKGFEYIEFSTPGILDVEIVQRMIQKNPAVKIPKFIKYMLKTKNENIKPAFQEFLQANLLSSYGRIMIRKKGDE